MSAWITLPTDGGVTLGDLEALTAAARKAGVPLSQPVHIGAWPPEPGTAAAVGTIAVPVVVTVTAVPAVAPPPKAAPGPRPRARSRRAKG